MSIIIDKQKCIGCGKCAIVCPGSLIKQDENKKAYVKYPKNCWGCTSCIKECSVQAVGFYLGADMGGMGSIMYVKRNENFTEWIIHRPNGELSEITTNSKESNSY